MPLGEVDNLLTRSMSKSHMLEDTRVLPQRHTVMEVEKKISAGDFWPVWPHVRWMDMQIGALCCSFRYLQGPGKLQQLLLAIARMEEGDQEAQ
ncbi:LOW QUALITY PROTEIN: hypothetical protein PHMEG_00029648 [Phytophthora megakarya]|uniref:Uncharacterized protein n=1 Tax=Phytophthora megakarya TaxID=4795 RepID=A0A225V2A2_9STRA|nr:LOW QUALITY PROTEIN: hypothetical protein PHMEG_00029648 [Phytophthora megakarya]